MKRFLRIKTVLLLGILLVAAVFSGAGQVQAREEFKLDRMLLYRAEQKYGFAARKRLEAWVDIINRDADLPVMEKLKRVNSFFNRLEFVSDLQHWKREDYWATPVEFIASGGGDCEDFTVAKYVTLKDMGVPEGKLSIIYVRALGMDEGHMVLAYFEMMNSEPLILDNLTDEILPAAERRDLLPIYSFNGSWLWQAKRSSRGELIGKSEELARWNELMDRMEKGYLLDENKYGGN